MNSRRTAKTLTAFYDSPQGPSEYGQSDDWQEPEGSTPAFGRLVFSGAVSCRFPLAPDVAVKGKTPILGNHIEGVMNCEFYLDEDEINAEKGGDREQYDLMRPEIN